MLVFRPADLQGTNDVNLIEQRLEAKLDSAVAEVELESGRRIRQIYIGKTFIPPDAGFQTIDPLNHQHGVGPEFIIVSTTTGFNTTAEMV